MVGDVVGGEHVGGQESGEGGGPEDQALYFVCVLPRVVHTQTRPERGSGEMQAIGTGGAAPDTLLQRSGPKAWVEGLHASTGSKVAGP